MITGEIKNQIDSIWNIYWTGRITDSMSVLEQMTYLFFMKMLDDARPRKEASANMLGVSISNPTFKEGCGIMLIQTVMSPCWRVFKKMETTQMFNTELEGFTPDEA